MKLIIPKGKLTKLSAALIVAAQAPNFIGEVLESSAAFQEAASAPSSVVSLIGSAGVIWGAFRSFCGYFDK